MAEAAVTKAMSAVVATKAGAAVATKVLGTKPTPVESVGCSLLVLVCLNRHGGEAGCAFAAHLWRRRSAFILC